MAKPPYLPPVLHGRVSREGLAALEPHGTLGTDFDSRLGLPLPGAALDLDLGGVAIRLDADDAVEAELRATFGDWLVGVGAPPRLRGSVAAVARLPTAESVTRLVVAEEDGVLRATHRGLMARVDLERGEFRALVEAANLRQDLTNLFRVLLSLYAPASSALLFRATAVVHDGCALLFAGPTLAGKTTVARLSRGREILTDDGLVLHVDAAAVLARSVGQWGGESEPVAPRRRELPVAAIFALRKAAHNATKPVGRAAAAAELAAAVPLLSRDSSLSRRVLELCARAAALVPVHELAFHHRDGSFWDLVEACVSARASTARDSATAPQPRVPP